MVWNNFVLHQTDGSLSQLTTKPPDKDSDQALAGRPLIDWVIQPALASGVFAEVWVSTD